MSNIHRSLFQCIIIFFRIYCTNSGNIVINVNKTHSYKLDIINGMHLHEPDVNLNNRYIFNSYFVHTLENQKRMAQLFRLLIMITLTLFSKPMKQE